MFMFRKANKSDAKKIYSIAEKRVLGLKNGIDVGQVWIAVDSGNLIGFCRVEMSEGKTLDYLKFYDIYIIPEVQIQLQRAFMTNVNDLVFKLAYLKAKHTPLQSMVDIMVKSGWKIDSKKFSFTKDDLNSYENIIYQYEVPKRKQDQSIFGKELKKINGV